MHIDALVETASDPDTWQISKSLAKEYSAEKQRHLRSLIPGINDLVADSVKNWNQSSQCKELTNEVTQIYKTAKRTVGHIVSSAEFNKFTQYVLFNISSINANRKIVITELKNNMVWSSEKVYKDSDGKMHIGGLRSEEECIGRVVTMERSSGATKNDRSVSIFFDKNSYNLCHMYRELKAWFFKESRVASKVS